MSKQLKSKIIETINVKGLTIRPRSAFILGSFISAIGIFLSTMLAILAIHLLRFRLTHPGFGAARKIDFVLNTLPWYVPVIAVAGLIGGYLLLKRYDFSYRKNFSLILVVILIGLMISSYVLDRLGLDNFLTRRGYFREIYGQEMRGHMGR
jgi:uncharacterized membrane protein YdcZ (DUF606 family)